MVQLPVNRAGRRKAAVRWGAAMLCPLWLLAASKPPVSKVPADLGLAMDGGRRLSFEQRFGTERDLKPRRGLLTRLVDFVAGAPDVHYLVRPYGVAIDSRGRAVIADPGAMGLHVVDFVQQKYKFVSHRGGREAMENPQCVAVDQQDNLYVTDPDAGKVFVFDANGKFQRTLGSLRGGEGMFKHPTGIAVDAAAQRIYVSDTWRNRIYLLDMAGQVVQTIGRRGRASGEFNYPTELRLAGDDLLVVDSMNFRVQVLGRDGSFRYAVGQPGDGAGQLFRPKGIALDSEGHLYVADAFHRLVQVFDRQGRLLYYFGQAGTAPQAVQMPAGMAIDRADRIYLVDSADRSLLQFHYYGPAQPATGGTR